MTDLGIYRFDETGEMRLDSLHPGATVEAVRETIGWQIKVAPNVETTPAPTPEELRLVREELDPGASTPADRWCCRTSSRSAPDHGTPRRDGARRVDGPPPPDGHERAPSPRPIDSSSTTWMARPPTSPVSTGLRLLRTSGVSTPRLLAALSTALDLTEGQLPGHALRTAFLAMRVADALGL